MKPSVAAVVIGRNERARLGLSIASVAPQVDKVVYVDSGSIDDSVVVAKEAGAHVVQLREDRAFTAARARNAGVAAVSLKSSPEFIQFVDGDCEVASDWVEKALAEMAGNPRAAVVAGRRRERHPEASVYNRLCDREWKTPVGRTAACGGDALIRLSAFEDAGGFRADLIAGEEPELCLRMRRAGWEIWRIDAEMTLHDAAIARFDRWWRRCRRAGYAAIEGVALHGRSKERFNVIRVVRALFWGLIVPVVILLAAAFDARALMLAVVYPVQVVRLSIRENAAQRFSWEYALFITIGKFPEVQGMLDYLIDQIFRRPANLIEYK